MNGCMSLDLICITHHTVSVSMATCHQNEAFTTRFWRSASIFAGMKCMTYPAAIKANTA